MATIHIQSIGDKAVISQHELAELVQLAQQSKDIRIKQDPINSASWSIYLAEHSGAFDFWKDPGEDIYSAEDGEPI